MRGEAVSLVGELRESPPVTSAPLALTLAQLEQLEQLCEQALDGEGGGRRQRARALQASDDVCDAESAVWAVRAMVSPDVNNMFNDFWGTSCGTGATNTMPAWQQEGQTQLTHAMLWLQSMDTNDICTELKSCPFCTPDSGCDKSDDGSASPASDTTIYQLYQQQGQAAVKKCSECDGSTSCLDDCLATDIVDIIAQSRNVSGFLHHLSMATLSIQYNGVAQVNRCPRIRYSLRPITIKAS